ncbi:MAG: response regulator [Chitinophagaceae bacterium]
MIKDKRRLRILVIEDNPGDYTLVHDFLNEQVAAPVITHAVSFMQSSHILSDEKTLFDAILLDLSLPDKSGKQLVTEILAIAASCPVIILTGFSDVEFSVTSISLGVSDYLLKDDLNAQGLYKSIVYCMERRKQLLELKESEKRYSSLFYLSPQPSWVYDPKTCRCLQVNKAATDCYEYSEEEFLSMNIHDLTTGHKSRKKYAMSSEEGEANCVLGGRHRHFKKTGEAVEVEIYSNAVFINNISYRSVVAIDITEKIQHERKISRAIIKTQEDERYEIGAELHDNVCQILASSLMSFRLLKSSLEPAGIELFNRSQDYILLATEEIRNLSHRLAPAFFIESTMEEAFERVLNDFNADDKFTFALYFDKTVTKTKIGMDLQLNLYRILQEQLSNILKYAGASMVKVTVVIHNEKIKMSITDDGIGFNTLTVKNGIGIANMKRRAELFFGKMEINSSVGNGCEVSVEIPLNENIIA